MIEVKLHDIGEGMTQADVLALFVQPGDRVNPDEPLVEVQTDKMTAEIPAPYAGVIKEVKVEVGQTISVGTTIFLLDRMSQDSEAEVASAVETIPVPDTSPEINIKALNEATSDHVKSQVKRTMASPYTRKLARENGIDIEKISGTGPAGRITDQDVLNYEKGKRQQGLTSESPTQNSVEKNHSEAKPTTIPFKGRRKQIAAKMTQSLLTIPHCTHFEEVDVTNILEMREFWKKRNASISATALFVKAISISLKEYPIFNARLNEEKALIELHEEHHIGVAIDTPDGLIVPVVRNVEKKSLISIHNELKELTAKAQENRLNVGEMTGSTFTISNVGPLGGSIGATPIINQPEVGLISFHKTKKRPVVNEKDEIVIRSMMNISMSFDHRVADGATAVAFTNRLTELLEEPKLLLLELV
ncbi:pyruvate dehydrogenase E2 component (dihydrolipoamide acetyltransferase) [Bacillus tianshenii]|uniref:Dihydrolipoamide acetyltransferase component of pyruvate dehydrogenase complex n=1 Tax=Sutcliffiella tianshenii TaxID=1463404 RepID=A0ABS2NXC0_9BACI|nr:dihydrolipoamide acetyltransferase family protein [Bacillus tianshenii]MBM7619319.1 pyruvate dehydrogenase E2 component (dihydrolipoamide acetyltransferase) [Bacillus tianshenii]